MEQLVVKLQGVEVSYLDQTILQIAHLNVHQFDRIGIVGKNGSGKSTLLKLIHGSLQGDSRFVQRQMEFAYFEQKEAPSDKQVNRKWLDHWQVPIAETEEMSGGEQTRLKLSQLFTHYFEGMLIDEPTTHLDEEGIAVLMEELTHYYGALILVSHDRTFIKEVADVVYQIEEQQRLEKREV
ncbi:ATP-binding cassette domain-containing protein [Shouchella sp. 1P09AA]|uniref:ATP-binding cassette domain-containing protein n=1 Tax=unclassified Shouchella TaxID=2893065 RepID=UPI0039A12D55